jgi:hypothetical protein
MRNIVHATVLHQTKETIRMAHTKTLWLIADIFGVPTSFLGIWLNIDNIKSVIIAILAICYLMLRAYYFWKQKEQSLREKEYELWNKEMDKQEREERMRKFKRTP